MNKEEQIYNTKIFCEMLKAMSFSLAKQSNGKYCLINSEDPYYENEDWIFEEGCARNIVDRLKSFIETYYFDYLRNAVEICFGIDFSHSDVPKTAKYWVDFLDSHEDFKKSQLHEYEVMKLLSSPKNLELLKLDDIICYIH